MSTDFSKSVNLPKTDFPMRANLPEREPQIQKLWEDGDVYHKLNKKNAGKEKFILHDGPPYANGDIHTGHAMNKILKDIIIKYKNMSGFYSPYVPGWDTHGLPIERQAIQKLGINRHEAGPVKFRQACREFAYKYVDKQKEQFRRLGVLGDWDNPYLTLKNEFVAKQIEVFGTMAKKGLIYKGLKPVYWCTDCETALAEAEIEYSEDKTNSIYVKFAVKDDKGKFAGLDNVYFVIWTTTTWTLPGNVAISVNPDFEYSLIKVSNGEIYVLASELVDSVCKAASIDSYEVVKKIKGEELEYMVCAHPFLADRESLVIVGDHVTLEAGTGCVHTAPGHGAEDYVVCRKYPQLPIIVPVDSKGYLNDLAGEFAGLYYEKSNAVIIEKLKETGSLLAVEEIIHQYPHCWRCGKPIVFRATEQWFASIDSFKDEACEQIKKVKWIPQWGEDRITSMVRDRSDWCISRQRTWGVPIPIFYCADCGKDIINDETINAVVELFKTKGPDSWWEMEADEILPEGFKCECGCTHFTKEKDIMDVWFDSGSSHVAVCQTHPDLSWPPTLYLEGNDQYRGWFQSSLLTSVATTGQAPYSMVITHGMITDGEGRKMSKSKGNGVMPLDVIKKYGADILRLWVISADFKTDMKMSDDALKQLSEGYRKIRNTARYILSNIYDFDPNKDMVAYEDMTELDKWAMMKLNSLIKKSITAYDTFEFHQLYHAVHNFCVVDMSNFYLDILKSRLYTQKADGLLRRSAQSAMYNVLDALVRIITPVLSFTAEELWQFMPHLDSHDKTSVMFADMPVYDAKYENPSLEEKWNKIIDIRADVLKALEEARSAKVIGQSLASKITVYAKNSDYEFLSSISADLPEIFISSAAEVKKTESADESAFAGDIVKVKVEQASGEKCERCWSYSETVGTIAGYETICKHCHDVLTAE